MQPGGKWTWPMLDSSLYHALVFNVYRRAFSCPKTILIICQNSHLFPFITNKYANQAQAKVSIIWSLQKRF